MWKLFSFERGSPHFISQIMSLFLSAEMKQTPQMPPFAGSWSRGCACRSEDRGTRGLTKAEEPSVCWYRREGWGKGTDCPLKLEKHNSILFTISLLEKSIGPRSILLTKLN